MLTQWAKTLSQCIQTSAQHSYYIHRIGRTGRAGASGEAISLASEDETTYLRDIEKLVGIKIPVTILDGFEPDPNASTEPIKQGQNRKQNARSKRQNNKSNSSNSNTHKNVNLKTETGERRKRIIIKNVPTK